jgi:hypothetical protein
MKYIILVALAIILWISFYLSRRQKDAIRKRRQKILERMRKPIDDSELNNNH